MQTMKVFLFTDVIDSVKWAQTLRNRDYSEYLRRPHDQLFHDLMATVSGGVIQDNAGDSFFATFNTPSDAVQFALAFTEPSRIMTGTRASAPRASARQCASASTWAKSWRCSTPPEKSR